MSSDDSDEDENKKLETIPDFVDEEREKLYLYKVEHDGVYNIFHYYKQFIQRNEANIKTYADCRRDHDSKRFLEGNLQLVCEHTFTYLFNMYIELDMEDKTMRSDRCTHQVLIIKHILQIIQDLGVASKQAVKSFFERMKDEDGKYKQQFLNEFGDFQLTIYVRALKNNDDLMHKEIQDCFESHDIAQLKQVLSRMIEEKRNYYLNQCITAASWPSSWETMTGGALVGNGEFSLRSRSKTLTLIKIKPYNISTYEDLYFAKYMPLVGGRVAPLEIAQKFSFEGHHYVNSMAIHKPFGANYDRICQFCPEANLISPFCRSQPSPYPFTT
ncbi:unnamed protein product [Rotaria sp. Silwood2]|nr:unnamed protein product [Rotaria sp. Silwood2]CAF4229546.1 unnamed protein product [Rotaria sp. Silwood2]